jgi:MFS family permease
LGNVVGPVVGGLLQAAFGIRSVFFVTGALLFVVAICAHRLVENPKRGAAAVPVAVDGSAAAQVMSHGSTMVQEPGV